IESNFVQVHESPAAESHAHPVIPVLPAHSRRLFIVPSNRLPNALSVQRASINKILFDHRCQIEFGNPPPTRSLPKIFGIPINYRQVRIVGEQRHGGIEVWTSNEIITIYWENKFAFRNFDAGIARLTEPLVGLMKHSVSIRIEFAKDLVRREVR